MWPRDNFGRRTKSIGPIDAPVVARVGGLERTNPPPPPPPPKKKKKKKIKPVHSGTPTASILPFRQLNPPTAGC